MSELLDILTAVVAARSRDNVALLLSGGIDSLSVGLALQRAGKRVHAYTFRLEGQRSKDFKKARAIAAHFVWPLTVITVPTNQIAVDFVRLAVEQRCRTKTQFEVSFPMAYVLPRIKEAEVWTGWNADRHYGNTRECIFRQRRMALHGQSRVKQKQLFDEERRAHFKGAILDPESGLTWWHAQRIAQQHRKTLLDPYVDDAVFDYFLQFDHERLSPLSKPLVREALAEYLKSLPARTIAIGVRLQSGAGVGSLFSGLLQNETINRFDKQYGTMTALCQRWGREVSRNPKPFLAELALLPARVTARRDQLKPAIYRPFLMADAPAVTSNGCTAVETFAGGGGSGLGLHQAGFKVVLANDFVGEAAKTYSANFPVPVDTHDIREITVSRAAVEAFLRKGGLSPGKADLLSGSVPCCEFCNLGGGLSDPSKMRVYSDIKQRGISTLIFNFVTLARFALPKTLVSENISNLGSVYRALLEGALNLLRFTSSGRRVYFANYTVLSADDFGTPQARQRLFVVAVRWDVAEAANIVCDADVLRVFPEPTHLPVSVRSALEGLQQSDSQIRAWRTAMSVSGTLRYLVGKLPADPIDLIRPRHVGLSEKAWFSLVRCSWHRPASTLTVLGQLPNGLSGALHPEQDRKFTLPELKRLTGLPDDFILTGTLDQAVERVCRMVPPALMRVVAESIYREVLCPYYESSP